MLALEKETGTMLLIRSPPIQPGASVQVEDGMMRRPGFRFIGEAPEVDDTAASKTDITAKRGKVQRMDGWPARPVPLSGTRGPFDMGLEIQCFALKRARVKSSAPGAR